MTDISTTALRIVVFLAGLFALATGLDQALGGLKTLGWMGQPDFYDVSDQAAFLVADNHQRFLGGVWAGMGAGLLVASTNLERYQDVLKFSFVLVFVGGLARFSQMNWEVTFGPEVLWGLITELVGMPMLFLWLSKVLRTEAP